MLFSSIKLGQVGFYFFMYKSFILFLIIFVFSIESRTQISNLSPNLVELWRYESKDLSDFSFLVSLSGVVIPETNGKLVLVDLDTGKLVWNNDFAQELLFNPFVVDGNLTLISKLTDEKVVVNVLSIKTGIVSKNETTNINSDFVLNYAKTIASDNELPNINITKNIINKKLKEKVIWKIKLGGEVTGLNNFKNNLLISSTDNFLYLINSKNGDKIWKSRFSGRVLGALLINQNTGFVAVFGDNNLYFFNPSNGKISNSFTLKQNETVNQKPQILNGKIFVQTNNAIICYQMIDNLPK